MKTSGQTDRCFVSLVKFSYLSKSHVNMVTGSGIMTIFFYKGLTRNPEIGNTPVWVLPNIWRLGWVMDTKLGTNVSNRMLLYAAKVQGYSSYCFWVIKRKPTGGGGVISPSSLHTQIWNLIKVNNKDPKIMFGILISLLVTLNIFDTFF